MRLSTTIVTVTLLSLSGMMAHADDSLQTHRNLGIVVAYNGSSFTGFGGKAMLSDNTSITFLFWLDLKSRTSDREIAGELGNQDLKAISFSVGLQRTFWRVDKLSLYGTTAVKPRYERIVWKSVFGESSNTEVWRELFLYAGGGAEYPLSDQFTLSAQHLFTYSLARYTYTYYDGRDRTVNESALTFGETALILTFYF